MRLIDADALQHRINCVGTNKFGMLDEDIREFIDQQPTVETDTKNGYWIDDGVEQFICSVCGRGIFRWCGRYDYCPKCGSIMSKGDH